MEYGADAVIEFPQGLPGFEDQRQFLLIQDNKHAPLVFLQSVAEGSLCFLCVPVQIIDPSYVAPASSALELVGLATAERLVRLSILTTNGDRTTANLRAPVFISPNTRQGFQVIDPEGHYSHEHPVEALPCS
jgi:flagellar assembly factor FliW